MALRRIVTFGEDVLRKKSREVETFDDKLWVLLDDMKETMSLNNGVGMAAPQVGILRRAVIVEDDGVKYELINPVITSMKGKQREIEGCLSSIGEWGYVVRPRRVSVKAFDRYGKEIFIEADGVFAITICHEIDHLNGIIFTDIADEMIEDEEELERAKKQRNDKRNGGVGKPPKKPKKRRRK